jgi:hypothetical protein
MRLLADENFPKPIVEMLRGVGHDVLWARTDCTGWKDVTLLDLAESESRLMLTLEEDFWQIAVQRSEFIPQHRRISRRWCGHSSRRIGHGVGHISIIGADGIQFMRSLHEL